MEATQIEVVRSGEWLPGDELIGKILPVLEQGADIYIDLAEISYLDVSSLQILLALEVEQKKLGREFRLIHAPASLYQWFNQAGATRYLQETWSENV